MKGFWACLLIPVAVLALSQSPKPAEEAHPHLSIADFGLFYPLSNDWVRATELLRRRVESSNPPPNFDILLAAVYVPKSNLSADSPFFSLRAYRQPATDCKKNLEAMIAHSQDKDKKDRPEGSVEQFSAAGRDYFRVNLAHGIAGRHQCMICTTANSHLLVWNAGAPNEKGLDAIVDTLNSITPLPQRSAAESAQSSGQKDGAAEGSPTKPDAAQPERVKVSSGVTAGLLLKRVNPIYPADARAAYIQGTVLREPKSARPVTSRILSWWTAHWNWRVLRWLPCVNGSTSLTCYLDNLSLSIRRYRLTISFGREIDLLIPPVVVSRRGC